MTLHQRPATNPSPKRLDETIQTKVNNKLDPIPTKVNNKLDPAVPVRTRTPSRAVPWPRPRAQHPADSPTTTSLIA